MVFLIKIVLHLFFKDDYDEIINSLFWVCTLVIAILTNIIFKLANWNGGLKTTIATFLILLTFFIVEKIISKIKDEELVEFNKNVELFDIFTGIFEIECYISSIYKIFITTILIIVSAVILNTGIIGTRFLNNSLCNKYNICILKNSNSKNQNLIEAKNSNYSLITNFDNITSELNGLIESFKNNSKEDNDKKFADFYKKLQQTSVDIRTYTVNDVTYFYEREELLKELEKENIKFSDNKQTKEITLTDYPILKFGYFEYARGFEVNNEYLISQFTPYLSEQWTSYLLLMKEQELDTHNLQPNADDVDSSFCMKWKNKLETFITTYPDFYLKNDINKEIEGYHESLKSIGLEE